MSVVACKICDNIIDIAADSITVIGYTQSKSINSHSKLVIVNKMIVGSCGYCEESSLFHNFCSTRSIVEDNVKEIKERNVLNFIIEFSKWKKGLTENHKIQNSYIIVVNGKAFSINNFMVEEILKYEAIGAGMDFALASLYLDNQVENAVKAACELSIYCEPPIRMFTMNRDTFHITDHSIEPSF